MKKTKIVPVIGLLLLLFASCSQDKNNSTKLVSKIVETNADGKTVITAFSYKGDHLVSTNSELMRVDYTYDDSLISQIKRMDKKTNKIAVFKYTYVKGKLSLVESSDRLIVRYQYNPDGTIAYEGFQLENQKEKRLYSGVLTVKTSNVLTDKKNFVVDENGAKSTTSISYDYDQAKNPWNAIAGFTNLLDHTSVISANNGIMMVVENATLSADESVTSSAKMYRCTMKYDDDNYLIEQIFEDAPDGRGYVKATYFY
ncbi:hypothetical protein [Flavobacterium sp. GNP001]